MTPVLPIYCKAKKKKRKEKRKKKEYVLIHYRSTTINYTEINHQVKTNGLVQQPLASACFFRISGYFWTLLSSFPPQACVDARKYGKEGSAVKSSGAKSQNVVVN